MKLRQLFLALLCCTLSVTGSFAASPIGHWEGAIELPGTQLGIRVDLTAADAGTIDIPLQALRGYALIDVKADGPSVSFRMPNLPGGPSFEGELSANGDELSGNFSQNGQTFPFSLSRKSAPTIAEGETPSHGIPGEGLVGHWQGALVVGPAELRLVLNVSGEPDALTATLDSLDQGAMGLPVRAIALVADQVTFSMPAIGASYSGKLSADGSEIEGHWKQGPGEAPLTFRRLGKKVSLRRPQEPTKPYPYEERLVRFDGGAPGVTLAGTLTMPRDEGPFPAVVLLTGSGPQDRDETLMGHRPFLVLADHLTRQGIAVLRFDDRGFGHSTGEFSTATIEDFAADGRAALEFLSQQPGIAANKVGLCGHSEGGVYAPLIAADQPDVAFIVMLAGVGIPVEELLHTQRDDMLRIAGINEEARSRQRELSEATFAVLHREGVSDQARQEIRTLMRDAFKRYTPEQRQAMGMTDGAVEQQIAMMVSPWFVHLLAYDPKPALTKVRCPVLALNGKKDLQVAWEQNLEGIRAGLAAGGNDHVTIEALPALNHLFQTAVSGSFAEYGTIEETMSPRVLETISAWIRQTTES